MRTGKLSIGRGHQIGEATAPMPRLSLVPREEPAACAPVSVVQLKTPPAPVPAAPSFEPPAAVPASPEYHLVHDRLTAIERLARLRDQGALSESEYEAEKALILALPADELLLHSAVPEPKPSAFQGPHRAQGPSLLSRLLDWRLIILALAAGLGLSYAIQPRETLRFIDEALRLLGA
ncbi:SHOCT domain-containing protein [Sphingosinicella sp. CPCC 101087]|uniref:SHOCT domain-containing protein n=1 Tax=Sphingosinicella sp. CPCC 101087 TaxID=2497754 RepID=UPI0019806C5F|nr:SHOCT domain-containing protein [Sphingosinicella sp. CPCC 101087]